MRDDGMIRQNVQVTSPDFLLYFFFTRGTYAPKNAPGVTDDRKRGANSPGEQFKSEYVAA